MLIKRREALSLQTLFEKLKDKKFNISLQYKMLKLKKEIEEEQEIYEIQMDTHCKTFFERDEQGKVIVNPYGGVRIKPNCREECQQVIYALNECMVQLPDLFFTLDELEELQLSFEELSLLEPFIKN